jgi:hypothetical protein
MNKAKILTGKEAVEFAERYNRLLTVRMPDGREYNAMPKQAHNLTLDTLSMDGSNILPSHISIEPFGEAIQCNRCQSWFLLNHLTIHGDSALCQSCFESSNLKVDLWKDSITIGAVWWGQLLAVHPDIVSRLLVDIKPSREMTNFFIVRGFDPVDREESIVFSTKLVLEIKNRLENAHQLPQCIVIQNTGSKAPMPDFTVELSTLQSDVDNLQYRLPQNTVMRIRPNRITLHFPSSHPTLQHTNTFYYWEK